jgi:lipoprotein-anchoring transpeptidase ErfK/SrfK
MSQDPLLATISALRAQFPNRRDASVAVISISQQKLLLYDDSRLVKSYPVSTSKYGTGNRNGSLKTPLGAHRIRRKIGNGASLGAIFKNRENTRQTAWDISDETSVLEDLITTRILWLAGLEPGINQGDGIDSFARYIYIHGTHEEDLIGQPVSHGCVRMTGHDVIELYDRVRENDLVLIVE